MALSGVAGGTMKVVAICGSFRKGSYNKGLIRSAIDLSSGAVEEVEIEEVEIASLPKLNTDLERQGTFPAEVEAFHQKILKADSILFSYSEYNFSVTGMILLSNFDLYRSIILLSTLLPSIISLSNLLSGSHFFNHTTPLKNAIDWGSRPPNVWGGKAAGIVSAGGLLGRARGQFHLHQIVILIDLHFLNKYKFFLNAFEPPSKFNPLNGDLIDEDAKLRLKQMLLSLKAFTLQLHHNN